MIKNCCIEMAGRSNQIIRVDMRKHEWQRLTPSSQRRLAAVIASVKDITTDLDPKDLTPTIYFDYGVPPKPEFEKWIVGRQRYTLVDGKIESVYTPFDKPIRESEMNMGSA